MPKRPFEGTYIGEDGIRRRKGVIREPEVYDQDKEVKGKDPNEPWLDEAAARMKRIRETEDLNDERSAPFLGKGSVSFDTPKVHRDEPSGSPQDPGDQSPDIPANDRWLATRVGEEPAPNEEQVALNSDQVPPTNPQQTPSTPEPAPTASKSDFPRHVGAGWYELSNEKRVRGKEAAAEEQRALDLEAKLGVE